MTTLPTTTHCQICARPIKAKDGYIAHHGYTRPGDGWQTASCMGAKFAPYEVSRDRIQDAITAVTNHITAVETGVKAFIATPPDTLKDLYPSSFRPTQIYSKPATFNAKKSLSGGSCMPGYESTFVNTAHRMNRDIEGSKQTLTFLQNRFASWVKTA